jgi:hypothetical protein
VHEKEETIPVKPPSKSDTSASVADLKENWSDLKDLDRDRAVNVIQQAGTINSDTGSVAWYADWLARWAFFAMPDSPVRLKALTAALDKQIKRETFKPVSSSFGKRPSPRSIG